MRLKFGIPGEDTVLLWGEEAELLGLAATWDAIMDCVDSFVKRDWMKIPSASQIFSNILVECSCIS